MPSGLKYREEIDGLRAISVIAVVLFHAEIVFGGIRLVPGGFLGVDVFFVISAYLITRILLHELKRDGDINFRRFYERRARRLLPMLLTVIVVSIPFAWFRLLPERMVAFAKSILAALTFVANFYFYKSTSAYGAPDTNQLPLLNTWSLGIEEQFYLIVPVALLVLYRLGRRPASQKPEATHPDSRLSKPSYGSHFLFFFGAVFIGSFALTFYYAVENPSLNLFDKVLWIGIALLMSTLSTRGIESPLRYSRRRRDVVLLTRDLSRVFQSFCALEKLRSSTPQKRA